MRSAADLLAIFFGILSLAFFRKVAKMTEKYTHNDWVVERRCKDNDGMGCPICKGPICKVYWKEGYDRHA